MIYSFRVNSHSEVDYLRIIDENKDAWAFVVNSETETRFYRLYISPKVAAKAIRASNQLVKAEWLPVRAWLGRLNKDTKNGWVWRFVDPSEKAEAFSEIEKLMTPPKHKVTITVLPAKRAEP